MIEVKAPFSLSEYQKGNYKVKYGDCDARIICTDLKSIDGPIVAAINGDNEYIRIFAKNGKPMVYEIGKEEGLHLVKKGIEDGDIISVVEDGKTVCVAIVERDLNDGHFAYHACLPLLNGTVIYDNSCCLPDEENLVMSSKEDKKKLFDTMRKGGHKWVDTEKHVRHTAYNQFKPFDKVLCRDDNDGHWAIDFFYSSCIKDDGKVEYDCMTSFWNQCVPFNEDTAYLIETKDKCPEEYIEWE